MFRGLPLHVGRQVFGKRLDDTQALWTNYSNTVGYRKENIRILLFNIPLKICLVLHPEVVRELANFFVDDWNVRIQLV